LTSSRASRDRHLEIRVIKKNEAEPPDLVLLDLNLPQRSGHEVLDVIRRHREGQQQSGPLPGPMNLAEMDAVIDELRTILPSLGAST
jgi:CheY-like chemotaxis protein